MRKGSDIRHFIEEARGQAGSVYGRQRYEVMRYWDDDHPEWKAEGTRLRGSVAEPAEMGRLALAIQLDARTGPFLQLAHPTPRRQSVVEDRRSVGD